jgi:hypothetical protein
LLEFQTLQEQLLERLIQESDPAEVKDANLMLRNQLDPTLRQWLPDKLLLDPEFPEQLLELPWTLEGLQQMNDLAQKSLPQPQSQIPPDKAKELVDELNLSAFLEKIIF